MVKIGITTFSNHSPSFLKRLCSDVSILTDSRISASIESLGSAPRCFLFWPNLDFIQIPGEWFAVRFSSIVREDTEARSLAIDRRHEAGWKSICHSREGSGKIPNGGGGHVIPSQCHKGKSKFALGQPGASKAWFTHWQTDTPLHLSRTRRKCTNSNFHLH